MNKQISFRDHIWTKFAYSNLYGSTKHDGKIREGKVGRYVCLRIHVLVPFKEIGSGSKISIQNLQVNGAREPSKMFLVH